jgi:hypothetical protein
MKVDQNKSPSLGQVIEVPSHQTESSHNFLPAGFDYLPSPEASSYTHIFSTFIIILQ